MSQIEVMNDIPFDDFRPTTCQKKPTNQVLCKEIQSPEKNIQLTE